jgi:hypothetical protein
VVEHIFALAVGLEIGRSGGDEARSSVFDQDRRGRPAGATADARRIFERRQEGMADERVGSGQTVPRVRIKTGDA